MKRLSLIVLLLITVAGSARPISFAPAHSPRWFHRLWALMACGPDPYPNYPWYKVGSSCSSSIGNNDLYAVFNIADSILYRLSSGTTIVNTPGCPPLPNPWYPYDSNCSSTIGNNDIYAVWYVLHEIDSLLIVNPPAPVPHGANPFMAYFFSHTQIDSMPYYWNKDSGIIVIPNNDGFKSSGKLFVYDHTGNPQWFIDTGGIFGRTTAIVAQKAGTNFGYTMVFGEQTNFGYYPNTNLVDTADQWQLQSVRIPSVGVPTLTDFIFRNGKNGYVLIRPQRSKKDTFAYLSDVRTMGNVSGTGVPDYIAKWTNGSTIDSSVIYEYGGNIGINFVTPAATLDVLNKNVDLAIIAARTSNGVVWESGTDPSGNGTQSGYDHTGTLQYTLATASTNYLVQNTTIGGTTSEFAEVLNVQLPTGGQALFNAASNSGKILVSVGDNHADNTGTAIGFNNAQTPMWEINSDANTSFFDAGVTAFGATTDDGSGNTLQVTGGVEVPTGKLTVTQLHIYASNTAAKAAGLKVGGLYLYILATTDTVVKAVH